MPPKGWRKNADGQYPQPAKDSELISIDEILFPRSTVLKLAKGIINEEDGSNNMIIAKDALIAIQRSATVFVSHVMFHANQSSKAESRKTVNTQDILTALDRAEFSGFIPEVKENLAVYEHNQAIKKKQKLDIKNKAIKEGEHATESPESSSKKLKDNTEKAVAVNGKAEDDEDEVEDDSDVEIVEEEEEEEQDDDDEVEDDEEESATANPIAQLGKEEAELGGTEPEAEPEQDSDNSDEEDE
ncbi:DNA polymerase epsilon subunit D [Scheffersomyces coipomensis]|uniref:DNA polymerase epsilon subunit D n=1 Tax=Scheffersomyces coipomensis TaxID=1788519 RepID=UPI00315C9356